MKIRLKNGNLVSKETFYHLPDSFKVDAKEFEAPKKPDVLEIKEQPQRGRKAKA
jgi:hypothetical protein